MGDHQYVLTNKQSDYLERVVDTFFKRAVEGRILHGPFLLLLSSVRDSIMEGQGIDQYEADVVLLICEMLFAEMDEKEFDPILEQIHYKIAGFWYNQPAWYERLHEVC